MGRKPKKDTFTVKTVDALLNTPLILFGPTKRTRKSAARKWLTVLKQASK